MDSRSTLIFVPVRSLDDVPTFESDADAREFWRSHFLDLPKLSASNFVDTLEFDDFELDVD